MIINYVVLRHKCKLKLFKLLFELFYLLYL